VEAVPRNKSKPIHVNHPFFKMKSHFLPAVPSAARALLLAIVVAVAARGYLISQTAPAPAAPPAAAVATADQALRALQSIQAANEKILADQEAMLKQLETTGEEARQLRIFARRT